MIVRRRKSSPYPVRVYASCGSLYYVAPNKRWHKLCRGLLWTAEAAKAYADVLADTPIADSVADLIQKYLDCVREQVTCGEKSAPTLEDYRIGAKNLIGFFGPMRPRHVTPKHVGEYKKARGKKSKVRCNRELSLLKAIFNHGVSEGYAGLAENPCRFITRFRERPRKRHVTPEEIWTFVSFAKARGGANVVLGLTGALAYLTTQRLDDLISVMRNRITKDGVMFQQSKGDVGVLVEWTKKLREVIAELLAQERSVAPIYLITNRSGQRYTKAGFKCMWNKLQIAWEEAGHERFHLHDLRAAGTSKMKADGRQAREITGHKTEATAERIYDRRRVRKGPAVE